MPTSRFCWRDRAHSYRDGGRQRLGPPPGRHGGPGRQVAPRLFTPTSAASYSQPPVGPWWARCKTQDHNQRLIRRVSEGFWYRRAWGSTVRVRERLSFRAPPRVASPRWEWAATRSTGSVPARFQYPAMSRSAPVPNTSVRETVTTHVSARVACRPQRDFSFHCSRMAGSALRARHRVSLEPPGGTSSTRSGSCR